MRKNIVILGLLIAAVMLTAELCDTDTGGTTQTYTCTSTKSDGALETNNGMPGNGDSPYVGYNLGVPGTVIVTDENGNSVGDGTDNCYGNLLAEYYCKKQSGSYEGGLEAQDALWGTVQVNCPSECINVTPGERFGGAYCG